MAGRSRRLRSPVALVAVTALGAVLGACGSTQAPAGAGSVPGGGPVIDVTVDIQSCGGSWSLPGGGPVTFAMKNDYYSGMDAYLTDARTGAYLAEYEGVGTGATLEETVTLGNGSYRFVCFPADEEDVIGPTVKVTGAAGTVTTTPGVEAVSTGDLIDPSLAYKKWITSRLPVLWAQARTLAADVHSGATAKAKKDWLTAHLTYETLGAAYDAFSSGSTDFDGDINGSPTPGADPATDKDLTGFHKVEALLWTGAPAAELVPAAQGLIARIGALIKAFPALEIQPNDLPLRSHEIVENAIQFELNAYTDAGSHTNLATAWANLSGAQEALVPLKAVLAPRYPNLGAAERALASTKALLVTLKRRGGQDADTAGWPALSSLSEYQRAQVNGTFQHTVELLAPIADICDVRNVVNE